MNIKALAKQAGFIVDNDSEKYQTQCIQATHSLIDEPLAKFAELVAAQEAAKWDAQTNVEIHEAVLEEREACAKLCEKQDGDGLTNEYWWECAEAIRARSKA